MCEGKTAASYARGLVSSHGRGAAMREPAMQEAVQATKQVPPRLDLLRMRRMQPVAPPPAPVEVQASEPAWKALRGGGRRPLVRGRKKRTLIVSRNQDKEDGV